MCITECIPAFLNNTQNLIVVIGSILTTLLLLTSFFVCRKKIATKSKIGLLYGTLFFSMLPIIYYFYARTCQNAAFFSCGPLSKIGYSLLIAALVSSICSFVAVPFLYQFYSKSRKAEHHLAQHLAQLCSKLDIDVPHIFVLDRADPSAFSISYLRPSIFVSVGLLELLSPKELEAVLLHELGHIRQGTSFLKVTNALFRMINPFTNFNILHAELDEEEIKADRIAVQVQGTNWHLQLAKQKMFEYVQEKERYVSAD